MSISFGQWLSAWQVTHIRLIELRSCITVIGICLSDAMRFHNSVWQKSAAKNTLIIGLSFVMMLLRSGFIFVIRCKITVLTYLIIQLLLDFDFTQITICNIITPRNRPRLWTETYWSISIYKGLIMIISHDLLSEVIDYPCLNFSGGVDDGLF